MEPSAKPGVESDEVGGVGAHAQRTVSVRLQINQSVSGYLAVGTIMLRKLYLPPSKLSCRPLRARRGFPVTFARIAKLLSG